MKKKPQKKKKKKKKCYKKKKKKKKHEVDKVRPYIIYGIVKDLQISGGDKNGLQWSMIQNQFNF